MTDSPFMIRLKSLIDEIAGAEYGSKTRFAGMLGVDPSYIDRWTNQKLFPSAEHLANIQEKLHISIDWLLTGKGDRYITYPPLAGAGGGQVREPTPPYGMFLADDVTNEEKTYIKKLIRIFHTKQEKTVIAIKQNLDAFLDTPNKQKPKKSIVNE